MRPGTGHCLPRRCSLPVRPEQVLIVDSESNDATVELARAAGFQVMYRQSGAEYSHGSTRQTAAEMLSDAEILVYMTQDAVLANAQALAALLRPFEDDRVGAVYGRQLPREGAGHIEAHARVFNYPATSEVRSMENARHRGFKAIFFSNSFGAYRRKALEEVGGFPEGRELWRRYSGGWAPSAGRVEDRLCGGCRGLSFALLFNSAKSFSVIFEWVNCM
jgi:GT2 family glycosyltransferase